MIRFDNFKSQYAALKPELDEAVHRVLDSGWFIMGKELEAFESEFAAFIGSRYAVGVASGTDAIALSLTALGIGKGDEVITSDMTAFPTIAGIMQSGAIPVLVDIDTEDGLMNPSCIEAAITEKTRAVMPVHLYGQSCRMESIRRIAKAHRLHVVEDCAQSVGATYGDTVTGTIGDIAAFSFYPTKNLGAYGDAGALTTNDEALYKQLLQLRNYGQSVRYYHENFGINSRLDEMQAAILRVKLKYLPQWNRQRREHALYYQKHLQSVSFLKENSDGSPVYHLFVIRTRPDTRDQMMDYLKEAGIQNLIHYPVPIHRQKGFYKHPFNPEKQIELTDNLYPNTVQFADEILSIPIYPELSHQDREKIVEVINEFPG
jgi:dTDP-4-amino-4,6-dideoxygalactose transaminase